MLFNSLEFIFVFLPIFILVYFHLNKIRLTNLSRAWVLIGSSLFYAYWKVAYVALILGSIIFNFWMGRYIEKCQKRPGWSGRKITLYLGLFSNLILLAYFKYFDFFITEINKIHETNIELLNVVLPIGISFYTFSRTYEAFRKL